VEGKRLVMIEWGKERLKSRLKGRIYQKKDIMPDTYFDSTEVQGRGEPASQLQGQRANGHSKKRTAGGD